MSGEVRKMIRKGLAGEARIEFSLRRPFRRVLFLLGIFAVVLIVGCADARIGVAAELASIGTKNDVRRAIVFDPGNPALYEQMGRLYQTNLDTSPAESIPWFRKAVAREPGSGLYWQRLAMVCEFAGERTCAARSFSRAMALDPMDPRIVWLAANDDLFEGSKTEAATSFHRLLSMDPNYANAVFAVSLRAYANPAIAAAAILPAHGSAALKLDAVNFLARRNDFIEADRIWSEVISAHQTFDFSLADPYLEKLIASGRIAQAAAVWRDMRRLSVLPAHNTKGSRNLVFNPDFEGRPLNAGFGWRSPEASAVNVAFGDPSGHLGSRCLRVDFLAPESHGLEAAYQMIPISAGKRYRLTAWVRSAGIASAAGPRLRVTDPLHPDCAPVETPAVRSASPWHKIAVSFSTCSETKLVRLSVWCPRDTDSPGGIGGHFWLDDVSLKRQAPTSRELSSRSGN